MPHECEREMLEALCFISIAITIKWQIILFLIEVT